MSLIGNIKLFPARESLVSDILAGESLIIPGQVEFGIVTSRLGRDKLFPARESLAYKISAVDGKVDKLFLQCRNQLVCY
jgi:hypothetical protein